LLIVYFLIISIILGFIRKGNILGLADLNLKYLPCVFIAFLIEASISYITPPSPIYGRIMLMGFVSVEYSFLFYFIWMNRSQHEILIMGVGILLNFMAIIFNHGSMPISDYIYKLPALVDKIAVIQKSLMPEYIVITKDVSLWFLGDIFYVPIPTSTFMSVGDIPLGVGAFLLVQNAMLSFRQKKKSN